MILWVFLNRNNYAESSKDCDMAKRDFADLVFCAEQDCGYIYVGY